MPYLKGAITALAPVIVFASSAMSYAEDMADGLLPENYDTPIAKEILKSLDDPNALKKIVVNFVNTSKTSLMCRLEVKPVYEQHMRQIAAAKSVNSSDESAKMLTKMFTREMVTRMQSIDEYCK